MHSLHTIRGVLAIWVVFFHLFQWEFPIVEKIIFRRRAYLAVDAFFVLSGFMLAYAYYNKFIDKI